MAKVQAQMSTEIALDLVKASESIKSMTNLVNTSTNAWKAQESQLKMTGDYLGATKAKYEGLGSSIQAQQAKIEALKQKQSELKGDTQQTAEQYLKFQQQIDQATTKLSSLEIQQNKAKQSMSYYQSGLADLQKGYRQQNDLSESYVKRLQAEGRENEALQAKLNGSKTAVNNLNKQYEAQVKMLKEVAQSGDGDAYVKQKQRINETATALAHAKTEANQFEKEVNQMNHVPSLFEKMKNGVKKFGDEAQKSSKSTEFLKSFVAGNLIANGISTITSKITESAKAGYEGALAAEKATEKWKNLGFAQKDIDKFGGAIKDLKYNTNLSGQAANEMITKFYGVTHSVDASIKLAKGVGSISDQLKLSSEQADGFSKGLAKIEASGKVTSGSLARLEKQAPGLTTAMQQASGMSQQAFDDLLKSGEMTSDQFNDILNKSSESYDKNAKAYSNTAEGSKKKLSLIWEDTRKALMKPLVSISSSGFNELSKVMQSSQMQKGIEGIGKGIAWVAEGATSLMKYIADHQKDLGSIVGSIISIGTEFGKGVWSVAKDTIKLIADSFNMLSGDSKKAKDPLHTVSGALKSIASHKKAIQAIGITFASYFIATKVINGIKTFTTTMKGIPLAFNAIKVAVASNPLGIFLVAVTTVGVALYELYKHNKKFKGFVDGLVKSVKDFSKGVVEKFKDGFKAVVKAGKATIDFFKKDWKEILLFLINPVAGGFALIYKHNKKFKDFVDGIWKTAQNFGKTFWKGLTGFFGNIGKKLDSGYNKVSDFAGKIKSKATDMWNHIKNGFKSMWDGMKTLAGNGINAVIKIPNAGISGINNLIADFGGSKNAIGKIPEVKFATGTGMFSNMRRAITQPTLAMLNDGHDSPETGHQEAVIMPNGEMVLPQGRNSRMVLPAGAEVLNATELKMLMSMQAMPFASGTGFWSKLWDSTTSIAGNAWDGIKDTAKKFTEMLGFIGGAIKDPAGTLAKKFNPNANKLDGVFNPLGNALFKTPKTQAKGWWSELWNMANEASNAGGGVMGAVGDDYPAKWKGMGKDAIADPWGYFIRECVSFVANRLNNSGVNPSLFSGLGNGNQWVSARVPHMSKPKIGSVAVYGPGSEFGNHVAMVTGVNGDKYSGEEYNWSGDGLYHTYANRLASRATTFLDFGLRGKTENSEGVKANTGLQKLIKKQVGGMFDWITKFLAPETDADPSGGGGATGVERWRSSVIKALKKNGFDATDSQVSAWMRVIQRESNGNPKAVNNWDSNAMAGIPSKGLVQTIEPTFNAYKHKGHDNIFNGYDNLLAGIAYMKARYGSDASAFARVSGPMGYANGGLVSKNGIYELAEGNMPEYIIPTDMAKRGRAWSLLAEVVGKFAGEAPKPQNNNSDSQALAKLEAKFDAVVGLLTQLVANGQQPIEVNNILDGQSFANGLVPYMNKAQNQFEIRQGHLRGGLI
ncbi:tape measure protein [Streptococcus parauberis]|uniref:tape measure protein n=1 Tax=Streptococcus parauberis TaxID=1348 RepID=UPI0039AEC2DC